MNIKDSWASSDSYEYFMGRWSRKLAPNFVSWINPSHQLSWLDLGCGTGSLTAAIQLHRPSYLLSIDPSVEFIEKARSVTKQGDFAVGSASEIPAPAQTFDILASCLALNFFPDIHAAFSEMKRVLKPGGTLAACVWDYAGRMDFLRLFWDAVAEVNPDAKNFDEGIRFPICSKPNLQQVFQNEGLTQVESAFCDIPTIFRDFEDYWNPFLGGQGPAPAYLYSQAPEARERIRAYLQNKLPYQPDGSIHLLARAIAIKGIK